MLLFTAWRKWLNLLSGAVRGDRRASLRPIHKRRWRLAVERL